jgi:UDP-N-acetylglucosamine acyltransferase
MSTETFIHPTAIVEKGAELGAGVKIGPYSMISAGAKIGDRSELQSHVVIQGLVQMGTGNLVYPFSVLGAPPQDLGYKSEPTRVVLGNSNVIRESVTIHRGTPKDKTVTTIGDDNYIMVGCHIAHDCVLGNKNVMANGTALAGHVEIGNFVNIGGQTGVVQKVRIGDYAFIGAGTILRKDLPPYLCAKGFSEVTGPNLVGMKRAGISEDEIREACDLYRTLYLRTGTLEAAISEMLVKYTSDFSKRFIQFVRDTKVGVQR